ncbi:MAG: tetratricopeptide repeat protein [Pyrinomonadaceae bacterium]
MPNAQLRFAALSLLFLLFFAGSLSRGAASQDSLGGASVIFITHPKNPTVHPKAVRTKAQQTSSANPASGAASKDSSVTNIDLSDEVEDALALGNSARDAEPPRYQDAEKAYMLAAKLDSADPRPYLGLANIWYDQKNYEAAAKMYREATERMEPKKSMGLGLGKILGGISSKATVGDNLSVATSMERAEAHTYSGNALLRAGMFAEAEAELRTATTENSRNAESHALLGYVFFQQKKYVEASAALKRAVYLSPDTEAYKQLLRESEAHQQQP